MRRTLPLLAGLVLLPVSLRAQTQVLDFENIPEEDFGLPFHNIVSYAGFTWSGYQTGGSAFLNWYVSSVRPASGTSHARTSEMTFLTLSRPDDPFIFNSIFLSTIPNHPDSPRSRITVEGWFNGVSQFSSQFVPNETTMQQYAFDGFLVDKVGFITNDGNLLLDDISITNTPEPASLALLATGMVGVVGIARKRRRSSLGAMRR